MTPEPDTKESEVTVPPWVILATFFLGWGLGGGVIAYSVLTGANNVAAFAIGGWLVCLPLIATRPGEVLRRLLGR